MKELKLLSLVLVAGTATMFTACTSESDNSPSAKVSYESVAAAQQVPVTFGTYMGETPTTRAGYVGPIDNAPTLQTSGVEFGVFGYYTNASVYNSTTSDINFMYNQKIQYVSGSWSYSPIKYWPNETDNGFVDGTTSTSASSTGGPDRLTFFAYAPFVSSPLYDGAVSPTTSGITALPANDGTGDPKVSYKLSDDALNSVDLLWGITDPTSGYTYTPANSTVATTITAGKPFINMVKPQLSTAASTPINFHFKHALARLALNVQATRDKNVVDDTRDELWDATLGSANKTKIVIDYVKLTGNFPLEGNLNLNNTTGTAGEPKWENLKYYNPVTPSATVAEKEILINTAKGNLATSLRVDNAAAPGAASTQPDGVKVKASTPLLAASTDPAAPRYFMFIPDNTNLTYVDVEIKYFVITDDESLDDDKSVITNIIKKRVSPTLPATYLFDAGNAYTWNLILGMETVSIDATVVPWSNQDATPVNLPLNVD